MSVSRSRRFLPAVALVAVVAPLATPSAGALVELPATVVPFNPPVSDATYTGVDYGRRASPNDDRATKTTWRVVEETGNCCETYVTSTPGGRLLDFGGRYIHYSDDRGLTWFRVNPLAPLANGEGAHRRGPRRGRAGGGVGPLLG
jgi:hypothetical protein